MATYNGTNGNNTITGSSSGDTMNGLDGNDVLNGGAGNDIIDGGNNDDTLIGGTGNDKLYGRDGDDNLDGGDGDDTLDGGNGRDVITGGAGKDVVYGGDGEDTIDGGDGNDTLDGGASQDVLRGGAGNDSVKGGDGDDKLFGGVGNDSLDGGTGQDVIYGDYDPASPLTGQSATVTFNSEAADNKNTLGYYEIDGAGNIVGVKFIFANASASGSGGSLSSGTTATVTAAAGNSLGFFIVSNGFAANNSYSSFNLTTGHLEFRNSDGSPATTASTAPQLYYVNASGVATAVSGATYHAAAGSEGAPLAMNADGKDHVTEVLNSNGSTTLKFEDLNNLGDADFNDLVITVNADVTTSGNANYNDNISGGDGDDKIYGQFGNDNIEGGQGQDEIYGGEGNDSIDGDQGDDRIYGGVGNDTLRGDDNNDRLFGEDGNDNIFGGTGDDQMDGGAGNDVVKGDDGNDTATYVASENVGSHDVYEGNKGWDTLKLVLTQAQYSSASVQQDIANYQAFLANNSNPNSSGGPTFHFNSFDLDVRTFENLQVVVVAPPNSAPDAVADSASVTEDQYGIINVLSNDSTGGDVGDALTVSGVAATSSLGVALSVNANGTVNYNAAGSAYLQTLKAGQTITDSFTYTVTDQGGLTDTATVTVTITGVNDAPTVAAMIADMTAAEDAAFTLATAGNFTDIDVGDTRSYSATLANGNPLPSWLTINAATGVISGTPANGDVGSISVKVTMTDGSGASANDTFNLTVTNTNDGPTVAVAIPDTTTPEDALFTFATAGNFADVDVGDTRAYSATLANGDPLPSWLSINAATGVLSGTPTNGDVGLLAVKVTMTDGAGASANDTFNLTVANVNDAPVVTVLIPDQSAAENAPFSYDTSGNFTDDDFIHGDSLTYTATLANGDPLPPWLTIDPNTGVISGTPPDVGAGSGLSGTVTFVGETAGYRNTLGSYEIDGSGNISAVKFVWDNSSRAGDGGSLVGGVSTAPVSAAPGNTLGFFLIGNGYDVNGQYAGLDLNAGHLEFRDSLGNPATTSTVNPQLWYVGTSGSQQIGGDIYHSVANNALNADGLDHTEETALGGGVIQIGFEDLNGLGDQDFDDTIFNLQLSGGATSYEIVVTATDESGASASDSFLLTIENVNDAPVVTVSIPDQTTPEDALFTYETSANFSDDDAGDSLTYSATLANGDPLPAWLSINPTTGQLFGTPANGDVGGISVLVTATDESGESVSDVFDLTVTNVNDAPVVSVLLPNQGMAEDVPFSFNATGYFTDVDLGDSLTYSATLLNGDPLPAWLSIDPVTGILSGTPANGDVGNIGVVITVTDESGAHTSDAFGLTVTNVNDVPVVTVAVPDQVTNEDAAFSYNAAANFADVDVGDALHYTATLANGDPLPTWLSFNPVTGVFSGTPTNGDVGALSITVTAIDNSNTSVSDTFVLTVANVNDAPVVTVGIADQSVAEDASFSLDVSGNFDDVDLGDVLSYSATLANGDPLPAWLSINPTTGELSGTPANGDVGAISIIVTATDLAGATANDTFNLTVANVNDVPVVTVAIPDQTTDEDAAFSYDASANFADVDLGDVLTYSATLANGDPLPAWLSIDPVTGEFSGTPANGDVGGYAITVTATDGSGATATDSFDLTVSNVNDAPVVTVGIADATTNEDATFSYDASANFADDDTIHGDVLSYSATLANGDPLPAWLSIDPVTGELSGTPANGDVGAISIVVIATDLAGATASDTFDLTIVNTNDGPTVTVAIADQTTDEDAAFSLDVSGNFADVDLGDVLSYSATLANGDPLPAWLSINPTTGELSGTPANGDVGAISVLVTATDLAGSTASDSFDLTVENVNDAPVVTVDIADATTNEDASFSYDASVNFADDDTIHGDVLNYSATLANGDPLPAWLSIDPVTGELSGTPANGDVGAISIVVTATDLAGATASDTFDLTIVNTNDGPTVAVAIADQTTDEDAAFSYDVSGNFADVDLGDVLSYSATLANGDPLPAWLSIDPVTGELSGTPANGDVGTLSIIVTATDLAGATAADTFDLTVENVNDAPVVTVGIADATTDEDAPFSYDASANFDDVDLGDVLSYSATLANGDPLPTWLSIDPVSGELSGTPANGDVGVYSIIVTATDLAGATASDTFDLTVANVNDTPVVTIGIADQTTDEDAVFSLDISGNFADVDLGDVLSFSATLSNGDPLPAWLSIDPVTGELSGTPANGDVGAISVLVTATDLSGATASDVFDLTVENVNDAPVVTVGIADASTDEDAAFSYDASANFADDDTIHGDVLSYTATLANGDPLPAWLSINAATGELSGTPANGDVGAISILVTATDLAGATASDMFDLTVVNTNDGPVVTLAVADQTTDEDAAFSYDVSGNFADVDLGDVLTFTATLANGDPLPSWLSFNSTTGTFSGTPANGDVGALSILVTATDLAGATAADTFDLTVTNVNDAPVVTVALADLSTDEDAAFTLDAAASFADDDTIHGDVLSYTATLANGDPLPAWLSINAATGELSGTPANGDVGAISILVTATDLAGATASDIFNLTIVNTNDGPTVSLAIPDQVTPEDAGFSFDVSGNFADVDLGDVLTFTATLANGDPLPSWLSFNSATGSFSGTPDNWDVGSLSVLVTASDLAGATASDTFDITVTNVNDAPVVTVALADQTVVEDAPFSYDTSTHFGDDDFIHGDSLTYTATLANGDPLPAWLSINPTTGVISGLLAHGAVGGDSFQNGTPSNNTINGNALNNTIDAGAGHDTVNAGAGNDDITAGSGNDTVYGGTGNDLIDGGSGTDSIEGGAGNDNITGGSGNDTIYGDYESLIASGSPLVITVTVTDESGASASDTFDLKFPANDDTIDAGSGSDYVDGGQGDDVVVHRVGENVGASDVYTGNTGHDTLRLVLTSAEAADSQIQQDIAAYQAFLLTHNDPNSDSGDVFQFTAFDLQVSNFENLEVVVEDTNTAPVVATPIADTATDEDAGFSYDVSGNFYDPDFADPLLYSAVLANGDPLPAWLSIDANSGTLSGTPDNDDVGLLAVVVTVTDSFGESASDTFNLSVVNVNDAPIVTVALADAALVEDAAFSYDASGAFADDDSIHGDVLSFSATLANGDPLPAWLSINAATGELSGTPANGDVGAISIIVTATDLAGATASDTFDLTISNVNDAPVVTVAIADQTTDEDALFSLDVSGNFADADLGDSLTYAATLFNGDPLPAWLSINPTTGELSGTPTNGDIGAISIIVTATDLAGATVSDTFDLTVENVNDAPVVIVGIADAALSEDVAFSYDASASFADDDSIHGDVLSFSATLANGDPLPAWLSINPTTGELSGTPGNGDVGAISIVVTATDLAGATASDSFNLTIANVNDVPTVTLAIADQTTDEDAPFSLDVSGSFADVDLGDVLTFSATLANGDPLPAWLSINAATGELSGTPENGDVGVISVLVTATDSEGATASDEFDLTVENINDAPVVTVGIADATIAEDAVFSYDASANFADDDSIHGDTLTFSATLANGDPLPAWLSINAATGELSGTPANGDVGVLSIIVTATDLAGATSSDTFDLTISNSNDGPTVSIAIADQTTAEDAPFSLDVSGSFADVDLGDVLTFSATLANGDPLPAWLSINAATGELSGTPENGDVGMISVLVTATDSEGATASDTFDLTVTNVNDAPVVTLAVDDQIATQDAAFSYDLSGNFADVDLGDVLSYSATLANGDPLPSWLSINPTTGELSGTPANGDVGLLSILVTATDLAGATASDIFDLTVDNENDVPTVTLAIADQTTDEDAPFSLDVSGNFADSDLGDELSYSATLANGDPLPAWLSIDPVTGELSGTPENGDVGGYSVTVTATDLAGASASDTFDLTVVNVNDAPVVSVEIPDLNALEDAPFSLDAASHFDDVDLGDELSYTASLANGDPLPAWLSFDGNTGTFSGTPTSGFVGVISLIVTATDLAGASVTEGFDITVENVNDAPTLTSAIPDQVADEDAAFVYDLSPHFADADIEFGDSLGFDAVLYSATLPNGDPLPGWLSINPATGELFGTPSNEDVGVMTIVITATDSASESVSTSFTLTVSNVNDAPVVLFEADPLSTNEGEEFGYSMADHFDDADFIHGDVLTYTATLANGDPLPAWLSLNPATGEIVGTPTNGDVGLLSILVTVTDVAGETASTTLELTIDNVNETPTVVSAIVDQITDEDAPFSLDVSGNFADIDLGDELSYSATLANGDPLPAWLSIDPVTGELSGTPENGDVGVISIVVTVTDLAGATASDEFAITVLNTNDGPVATVDAVAATEDVAITYLAADLLANDSDIDVGDALTISGVSNAVGGTVELTVDGDVLFTPTANFSGTASFDYTVADGNGGFSTATVTVAVAAVADAPIVTAEDVSASFQYVDVDGPFTEGSEFLVNTTIANGQNSPSITALADGGFVVTWHSPDANYWGVSGQRYDAAGSPVGGEFQVNTQSNGWQFESAVSALSDGGFVVTWQSNVAIAAPYDIRGQIFDANGTPVGGNIAINSFTTSEQHSVDVTGLAGGGFVATWVDNSGLTVIKMRIFDAAGAPQGNDITLASGSDIPSVSALPDGGFLVATGGADVVVRQFNADGTPAGTDILVSTANGYSTDVTALTSGGFVVTWTVDTGGSYDIYARAFDANGSAIGDEFLVDNVTALDQTHSVVTALADGGFVISWQSEAGGNYDVLAQRYDANGDAVGSVLQLNDHTASDQYYPAISALPDGGFVAVWASVGQTAGGASAGYELAWDIFGKVYEGSGVIAAVASIDIGAALSDTDGSESISSIVIGGVPSGAELSAGIDNGDGTWTLTAAELAGLKIILPAGLEGTHTLTATVTSVESANGDTASSVLSFNVSVPNSGPNVVADIADQITPEDALFTFDTSSSFGDINGDSLTFAATLANGDPLPAWLSINPTTGELSGTPANADVGVLSIIVTATDDNGATVSDTFDLTVENVNDAPTVTVALADQITDEDAPFSLDVSGNFADIDLGDELSYSATLANGDPLPAWLSIDPVTGELSGTPENGDVGVISIVVTVTDLAGATASDEFAITVLNTNDGPVATVDAVAATEDVAITYLAADLLANDSDIDVGDALTISGVSNAVGGTVELTVDGDVLFTPTANFSGTASFDYTVADGNGGFSTATVTVAVAAVADAPLVTAEDVVAVEVPAPVPNFEGGDEFFANDTTAGNQVVPSVLGLANGNFVTVWSSVDAQDGDYSGVFAKIYAPDGSAVTAEFQVNTFTSSDQLSRSVTSLANGDFVITWTSGGQDGDSWGIYGQRFTVDGTPVGGEFAINTETSGSQESPTVTSLADGGFLIAWQSYSGSQDGSGSGIYAQRFDAASSPVGSEFIVNTTTANSQALPVAAGLADGGYVVAWQSEGSQDGWSLGIYAQRYDANGNAVGGEFQVNSFWIGDQSVPSITALASGGFVVTWQADGYSWAPNQDADNWGIYSRVYDANGNALTGEILVNSTTENQQIQPSVTALADGGYFVSWSSFNTANNTWDVYGQRFDAAAHKVGDELLINSTTDGTQWQPSVTTLANGSLVVSWYDYGHDGSGAGIATRIFTLDTSTTIAVAGLDIQAALADLDGSESILSVLISDLPAGATLSAGTDNGNGSWSLTPAQLAGLEVSMPVTPPATYSLTVAVTSIEGANGDTATTTITFNLTVPDFNHAPIVTFAIADQTIAQEDAFSLDVSGNFADVDLGDVLTYSATLANGDPLPAWLSINPTTGELSGTPDNGDVGSISITVTATDEGGLSASDTLDVTVTNVNDTPVVTVEIADQATAEDALFSLDVSGNFADADIGDVLTYSITGFHGDPLPSWISIDANTGVISGTPDNGDVGSFTVEVSATDASGAFVRESFILTVENVNDAPVVTVLVADGSVDAGELFSRDLSAHFADDDSIHGDVLTYAATLDNGDPLPAWLSIDPNSGVISGTPALGDIGAISIIVTVTDIAGATASDMFDLAVTDINTPPVLTAALADQTTDEDALFAYDLSGNFADSDLGDALSYTATLANGDPLPSWLSIDANTGVISGVPSNTDVTTAPISILVTATDLDGLSASDTFDLTVDNVNDAPVVTVGLGNDNTWVNAPFTYETAASFADVDGIHGDTLTFSATLNNGDPLPAWLTIDPQTGVLSGTPIFGNTGTLAVTVTATDLAGATASDTFNLTVTPVETDGGTPSQLINTYFLDNQLLPDVTTLTNGDVVLVWSSLGQDGSSWGVYGQRVEQDGTPVGGEFHINTTTIDSQIDPSITELSDGGFMVTWTSFGQDGNDYGIYGQRFDAEGSMVGSEFHINTAVVGDQDISSITTLSDGGFVVTWNSLDADTHGVFGQKFDADANPVGGEFQINTTTSGNQDSAEVAGLNNGGFVVVWNANATDGGITQDGWGGSVQLRIFGADGNPVSGEIQANTYWAFEQINPSVAVLEDGSFVVVWQSINQDGNSWGIFGQHFAADGSKIDAEFAVNTTTEGQQVKPAIGSLPDGGFVVSWTSIDQDGSAGGIYAQRFDADGATVGAERRINDVTANDQINSVVTGLDNGGFAVAYDSYGQEPIIDGVDDSYGVFLRFFYDTPVNPLNDAPILASPIADQAYMEGDAVSFDVSGSFSDPNVGDMLLFTAAQADGSPLPAWLSLNPVTGEFSGTPPDGGDNVYHLIVTATDAFGATVTDSFDLTVGNANPGDAMLVNDTTYSDQLQPSIAALADGNSVVVWSSLGQDGDSWGVFMKIYAPDGSSLSNELQVNTFDSGDQQVPTVTALAAGGFVVTWASYGQDGSAYGVYGQMFAADGTPQGSEFLVNSATTGNQDLPVVTALDDGGFVVAWQSNSDQDGSGFGIYSQRFDASGVAVGGETLVNSTTAGSQQLPSIASLNDGGYIVAWQSDSNQDGWATGIYTQRYDAAGAAVGGETLVNSFWVFAQTNASVSALASGGYVVTWQSESQGWFPTEDGDNWGVFAKVYDANGVALTGDVLVNTTTADQQLEPSVTGLPDGGFYVTWTSYGQDGDGAGIYGQQFDAAGNKVGGETLINDLVNGQQLDSAVTVLANGDISVTWTDVPNDGSGYGVFSKIIDITPEPLPSAFGSGDDVVDFNLIPAGTYDEASMYNSGDGNDTITLPYDFSDAAFAGFVINAQYNGDMAHAFDAGAGDDTVTGSGWADFLIGGDGADYMDGNGALSGSGDYIWLGANDGDQDVVAFHPGALQGGLVFDFVVGEDKIDVSDFGFSSFAELQSGLTFTGDENLHLRIVSGHGLDVSGLTLVGVSEMTQLTEDDFIF